LKSKQYAALFQLFFGTDAIEIQAICSWRGE